MVYVVPGGDVGCCMIEIDNRRLRISWWLDSCWEDDLGRMLEKVRNLGQKGA